MGISGYPHDLPGSMKIIHKYIADIVKIRNLSETSSKYHVGTYFTHPQAKNKKGIKNTNRMDNPITST